MATISEKEIKFNKEISETLYGNGKTFDEIVKADISENEFKEQAKKLLWTSEEIENFLSKHKEEIEDQALLARYSSKSLDDPDTD